MEQHDQKPAAGSEKSRPPALSRGIVAGIVVIFFIAVIFAIFIATGGNGTGTQVPAQECGQKVITYLNNNLVQPGTSAQLKTISEKSGVYEVTTRYQERDILLYATRDCSLLFTNTIPMGASGVCNDQATTCSSGTVQPTVPPAAPVKSSRPSVDLYVMSFCPYGVQAETLMQPIVDLLGRKADINVRYITTVQGTSIDSVQSLHGVTEAREDARQLCIAQHYPEKYWKYLAMFDEQCYPLANDAGKLDACQKNVTALTGISAATIDPCATGTEGIALLKADEAKAGTNQVSGSPTLLINGQEYQGARSPEAYKKAICDHFDVLPPECATTLSTQGTGVSGGCG
jgi:glutaredoxin